MGIEDEILQRVGLPSEGLAKLHSSLMSVVMGVGAGAGAGEGKGTAKGTGESACEGTYAGAGTDTCGVMRGLCVLCR